MICEHGIEGCVYCADEKPMHVEHSMHACDGEWVGFLAIRTGPNSIKRLGMFQVRDENWEEFKRVMEPIATFAWSFS